MLPLGGGGGGGPRGGAPGRGGGGGTCERLHLEGWVGLDHMHLELNPQVSGTAAAEREAVAHTTAGGTDGGRGREVIQI